MSDDILNRIDRARPPSISRGIVQFQRPNGEWVTIGHVGETPADRAERQRAAEEAARAAAAAFAAAWEAWIESIRPAFEYLRDAMAVITEQQRASYARIRPPRVINPTKNRTPHQTNRHRGGHRG